MIPKFRIWYWVETQWNSAKSNVTERNILRTTDERFHKLLNEFRNLHNKTQWNLKMWSSDRFWIFNQIQLVFRFLKFGIFFSHSPHLYASMHCTLFQIVSYIHFFFVSNGKTISKCKFTCIYPVNPVNREREREKK